MVVRSGPDGTITLAVKGKEVYRRGFGDFDGDDRSDFLVEVFRAGAGHAFIVQGSVTPGVYDPERVGVSIDPPVPPGDVDYAPTVVGDQDRDGADDVSFGPRVYSGRVLMTAGPGPQARLQTLPAQYIGLLQLDPAAPPTFVVPEPTGSAVAVLGSRLSRLQLGISRADLEFAIRDGLHADGRLVDGHHIVELEYFTRSGSYQWRFDLDAPCET